MRQATRIILLASLGLLATALVQAQAQAPPPPPNQDQVQDQAKTQSAGEQEGQAERQALKDPFYPGLPYKTVKIRYRLKGRFEGQEMLAAKSVEQGVLKVQEIRCTDTALGLERPVHLWILELPEKVIRIDLVNGGLKVVPNLRSYFSRAWKELSREQKTNLAENLPLVGPIVGKAMKLGVAVADEAAFLGLSGIKVALGSGRAWYWSGTDLVIKALGYQGGFGWDKEAIDIITDEELSDSMFRLPLSQQETTRLQVSPQDRKWAETIAQRVVGLLSRPLQGDDSQARAVGQEQVVYKLPVPWPFPPPPGFETAAAQYRLDPNWAPYPESPDRRSWPPPGLRQSILNFEAQEIAALLLEKMPSLVPADEKQKQAGAPSEKDQSDKQKGSADDQKGSPDKSNGPPGNSDGPPDKPKGPPKDA